MSDVWRSSSLKSAPVSDLVKELIKRKGIVTGSISKNEYGYHLSDFRTGERLPIIGPARVIVVRGEE